MIPLATVKEPCCKGADALSSLPIELWLHLLPFCSNALDLYAEGKRLECFSVVCKAWMGVADKLRICLINQRYSLGTLFHAASKDVPFCSLSPTISTLFESYKTQLHTLSLANCAIIDIREVVRLLPQLTVMSFFYCRHITEDGVGHITKLVNLKHLDFSLSAISDKGLHSLRTLTDLKSLDLSYCKITDVGVSNLCSLTHLRSLALSQTLITDEAVQCLASLPKLRNLNLSLCYEITDRGIAFLTQLQSLQLFDCRSINGTAFHSAFVKLKYLDLSHCRITHKGLACMATLPQLQRLNLAGSKIKSSSQSVQTIIGKVQDLDLARCWYSD